MAERPVRALRFSGFGLGIWGWPLVNTLLEMMAERGTRSSIRGSSSKTAYSNVESYKIFEPKPGVILVEVHRKAERG